MQFGKLFPRMYLGVTAGLIDGCHHKRLGAAWMLFCWCCMRQTGQGEEGVICRGAVITYAEIADEMNCSPANVRKWMYRLTRQGYLRVEQDRRGLRVFIKNPKKTRLSKLGQPERVETAQLQHARPPSVGHSNSVHLIENASTSEILLRSDLTKRPKNNNTTADAKSASVSLSLKELGKIKTIPQEKTPREIDAQRRKLLTQAEEIKRKYPYRKEATA